MRAGASVANEFRVFDIRDTAGDVSLEGLTVSGGRVVAEPGGAIRFQSAGDLIITRSSLATNTARTGGAILADQNPIAELMKAISSVPSRHYP